MKHNPRILNISTQGEAVEELNRIGVEPYGIEAMVPKMIHFNLLLEGIQTKVANILKQEMLSIGGDVAVSRGTVDCSREKTDAVVMGTLKQIERFIEKISRQPFGIARLAEDIRQTLSQYNSKTSVLKTSRREIRIGERPLIMGILNVTPDSFSDGGLHARLDEAVELGLRMEAEGADIIDIGGESSRPGSEGVSADMELGRVVPVIAKLTKTIKIPLSIDTVKLEVAEAAAGLGAEILNDISALTVDDRLAGMAARTGMAVVLMHMRGKPRTMQAGNLKYASLRGELLAFLRERVDAVVGQGVERDRIAIDPGIGFGKTTEDNLKILKHLREFKSLGLPLLVGPSRKTFIGKITGESIPADRTAGTAAAVAAAVMNGADIIRVHDVKTMRQVADMSYAVVEV